MPVSWPSIDQTVMISGVLLEDPLVSYALAYVQSVVCEATLAIAPSAYIYLGTVICTADTAETYYWPKKQCIRTADTAEYNADIITYPNDNEWGLTFDNGPFDAS